MRLKRQKNLTKFS